MNLFRLLHAYIQTKQAMGIRSRRSLEARQQRLLTRHFQWVLKHSRFYRRTFADAIADWDEAVVTFERLEKLPLLDKETMMAHFDELNTVGIRKEEAFRIATQAEESRDFTPNIGKVTVGLSSGTSGNRGLFLVSAKERERWAGVILAKVLPRGLQSKESVAFFLRANSNLYTTVQQRRLTFQYYDLFHPLSAHVERLNQQQPTILLAPPAMLLFLSHEKKEGRLQIDPIKVVSIADVLDDRDRETIAAQFGQPIHQIYQCTEGFLAATCSHGTLHLNEDLVHIGREWIDRDSGRFVPIVTDFSRTIQPIVRYRLNDVLVEKKEPCPCGSVFTAIERVEGRCDDIFYLKERKVQATRAVFPDLIRRAVWQAGERVLQYRVVQQASNVITVAFQECRGSDRREAEDRIRAAFFQLFERLDVQPAMIRFTPYQAPVLHKKMRRVERMWSP
ncbi:F390 synthetase-related protein [Desmospora activa]|uniref:Putative adenylate-forming enzyme n=1 Tax=Desmospora activa DSM 45169 TaxID=1121389 RepID=A0A2T4ZD93_9BACL|nr:F390 synthetase-related protein [Desmospora activa]PTM59850.1 putative adenylate-forming enzyme [Desmospora activa DSM 45169]